MRISHARVLMLALLAAAGAVSCATLPSPSATAQQLVFGAIHLEARNYAYYGNATVNGTHANGIRLTFINLASGEKTDVLSTSPDGLFFLEVQPHTRYQLQKVEFRIDAGGGAWANVTNSPREKVFDTGDQKVLNLGMLDWTADKAAKSNQLAAGGGFDEVKAMAGKQYPGSPWVSYDWDQVDF